MEADRLHGGIMETKLGFYVLRSYVLWGPSIELNHRSRLYVSRRRRPIYANDALRCRFSFLPPLFLS